MKTKLPEVEWLVPPTFDEDGVQASAGINLKGKEVPDPMPMAPPVGYRDPPDLMTMIRTMIQSETLRNELQKQEMETFEEADDFDIEDDPVDPLTDYEAVFEPPKNPPPAPTPPSPPPPAAKTEVLDTSVLADTSADTKNIKKSD